jgi:hypothetical protein
MKAKAHRIVGLVGAGLATAVVLAGSAQAADRPDDRGGLLGVGAAQAVTPASDVIDRAVQRQAVAATAPVRVPDALDRAVFRESAAAVQPPVTSTSDGEFAWGDAFFGAAVALFIVLLGGATALTIRHRGRVILP